MKIKFYDPRIMREKLLCAMLKESYERSSGFRSKWHTKTAKNEAHNYYFNRQNSFLGDETLVFGSLVDRFELPW